MLWSLWKRRSILKSGSFFNSEQCLDILVYLSRVSERINILKKKKERKDKKERKLTKDRELNERKKRSETKEQSAFKLKL